MAKTPKADKPAKHPEAVPALRAATKTKAAPPRQVIVVLAMHRTGSSAITRVLSLLGCDLPHTLMGEAASNQAGHWESDVICNLDDEILASAGSDWRDWHPFNPNWYKTSRRAEFETRALEVLDAEYGSSPLFVIKDPRMARIFPFWRDLFRKSNMDARVVMPLRHPVEVMASLRERDGMLELAALLLWLRHMLDAEHASRNMKRAVVAYGTLLASPSQVALDLQDQLGLFWPRLSEKSSGEIQRFLSPALKHHTVKDGFDEGQTLRVWLDTVYGIFKRWSLTGEDKADHAKLDEVRQALDSLSVPLREAVVALTKVYLATGDKNKEIAALQDATRTQRDAVATLTQTKGALEAELAKVRDNFTARDKEAAWLRVDAARKDQLIKALTDEKLAAEADLAKAQALHEAEVAEQQAGIAEKQEQIGTLSAALQTAGEERALAQADLATQQAELATLRESFTARDKEAAWLRVEAAKKDQQIKALSGEKATLSDDLAKLQAALDALQKQRAALDADLSTTREARAARDKEAAWLRVEAAKKDQQITALTADLAAQNKARDTEVQALQAGLATATAERDQHAKAQEALTQDLAAREATLATLTAQLQARSAEAATTAQHLAQAQAELATATAELDNRTQAQAALTEDLEARDGLFLQPDKGEFARPINGYEEMELAFGGLHLGDIDMEVADRIALELFLRGHVACDVRQARDVVTLEAAVQRRATEMRDRRLQ